METASGGPFFCGTLIAAHFGVIEAKGVFGHHQAFRESSLKL